MNTEAKIITRFAAELANEPNPLKAAWITCDALANEARELWGDEAADTVYRVSADVILDAMTKAVTA